MNIIKHKSLLLMFLIAVCSALSCKDNRNRKEIAKIVNEWIGKEILFPENVPCYVSGRETLPEICNEMLRKEFKILMYVDSVGCSDCRLRLFEWKQLMDEADKLFQGEVGFLLFFQPESVDKMPLQFEPSRFNYPVFMDTIGAIHQLNRFPQEMEYQCFLLDKDNKVVMVGNPVLNQNIWKMYKSQIAGVKDTDPVILTTATIDKTVHDYGIIRKGTPNPTVFTITNTGNHPFIISRISASCGCTNIDWEKQAVEPGQTTAIRVEMTPDEAGFFSKTINVYCNIKGSPIRLMVTGNANE